MSIKNKRIKCYRKILAKQFDLEKDEIEKINTYTELIQEIRKQYSSILSANKEKLFIEKIKIKDNINRCSYVPTQDLFALFITIIITFIAAIIGSNFKKFIEIITKYFLQGYSAIQVTVLIFSVAYALSVIALLIVIVIRIVDYKKIKNIKGYNLICLEIIERFEELKLETLDSVKPINLKDKPLNKKSISEKIYSLLQKYKNIIILVLIFIFLFGPIIATRGPIRWLVELIFNGSESSISYMQYLGSVIGGLATLIALYITVKQTIKIQEENKEENKVSRKIDDLKLQIEYSKKTFKYAYEYQLFLDSLDKELEKIIRRTNLLEDTNISDQELALDNDYNKSELDYETMQIEEQILADLDIYTKVKEIYNKLEVYTKKIMMESASIVNKDINTSFLKIFSQLENNTKLIEELVLENKDIDKIREVLNNNSSINITVNVLIDFQVQLKDYITSCQNKINNLSDNDLEKE